MQFNLTTIFFLLPSLITLMIMRLRRQPWMKTLSVLGWRLGSPIHYLWALLALLISATFVVLLVLFMFSDLYPERILLHRPGGRGLFGGFCITPRNGALGFTWAFPSSTSIGWGDVLR